MSLLASSQQLAERPPGLLGLDVTPPQPLTSVLTDKSTQETCHKDRRSADATRTISAHSDQLTCNERTDGGRKPEAGMTATSAAGGQVEPLARFQPVSGSNSQIGDAQSSSRHAHLKTAKQSGGSVSNLANAPSQSIQQTATLKHLTRPRDNMASQQRLGVLAESSSLDLIQALDYQGCATAGDGDSNEAGLVELCKPAGRTNSASSLNNNDVDKLVSSAYKRTDVSLQADDLDQNTMQPKQAHLRGARSITCLCASEPVGCESTCLPASTPSPFNETQIVGESSFAETKQVPRATEQLSSRETQLSSKLELFSRTASASIAPDLGTVSTSLRPDQLQRGHSTLTSPSQLPVKSWNYRQLVTSVTQREYGSTLAGDRMVVAGTTTTAPMDPISAHLSAMQLSANPALSYFGFRRPPKRLIYFYDINDDVDEEIEFLSTSLESKSYATSMLGQHDHYLENIARTQAAASRAKAATKQLQTTKYKINMYHQAEREMQIRALAMEGAQRSDRSVGANPATTNEQQQQQQQQRTAKRFSSVSTFAKSGQQRQVQSGAFEMPASASSPSERQSQRLAAASVLPNVELLLSPHWSSLPSHLNQAGLSMMRFYQSSFANNFYLGKRERALLNERGQFDRACCRVDEESYRRALRAFMAPQEGAPLERTSGQTAPTRCYPQAGSSTSSPLTRPVGNAEQETAQDINLRVVYEPLVLLSSASSRLPARMACDLTRCRLDDKYRHPLADESRLNRRQQELLRSLERYTLALLRYEEKVAASRATKTFAALTSETCPSNGGSATNLARTTQAIRRGSVVVFSKLKLLHSGGHTADSATDLSRQHQRQPGRSVPRLSLTKADSLLLASSAPDANCRSDVSITLNTDREPANVAIHMSSEESLSSAARIQGAFASPASLVTSQQASPGSAGQQLGFPPNVPILSRHSIANLPMRALELAAESSASKTQACEKAQSTFECPSQVRPSRLDLTPRPGSCAPNSLSAPGKRQRPSIIGWLSGRNQPTSSVASPNPTDTRNSCFSQSSKATSELTDRCTKILKPSWYRRRSFSGPFEWLQTEHRPGFDLMLEQPKKQSNKKRLRKIKPQKSNSSDFHSLNNRRVYRLDSRGFQTKLKGTFYVISHDPLATGPEAASGPLDQFGKLDLSNPACGDFGQQHQLDCISSNEADSSFFNTSNDEQNSLGDRSQSRETGRSTSSRNQPKRTFLLYFYWTQWMVRRRHYSLFLFSPRSRIRRFCLAVTNRKEFDYFVLFFISMNCVTLAMERPKIPPWSLEREFLTIANYYFTFMFTLEMALKVIAKGLYYGNDAYLSDSWNIMDGALVGFSLFDLLLSIVAERSPRIFAILRVFRLLRSLRPLRVINRLMGLKLVVQTLLLSLRPIGNIVLICCTFFIIFGILGVQLFKGTFYYCDGPDPLEIMRTVRTKQDCLDQPQNRWINRKYNFDNLGQALMALFVLSSKDGWVNIMYTGLDAVGVDMQPRENYNEWRLLYFISFLLLVAFFVLNMFVGVVVENFHRCRKEQELEEKARRAEKRQRKLDKRRRKLREPPYYSNYGKFRLLLHRWVTGGYFDLLIAAVIGFNVVFMSLEHYQMPGELIHLLKVSNYVFTAAFILEAAIKSTALGMRRYLKDRWNQLDVMIVAMSIIGIIFEEMDSFTLPINPTLLRVLRVMRIARVLKLLKMAKGIRALLDTVMQALPQVGNLGLLFFLLFFIFAALGVELFGRLECNDDYPCSGLMDQHAHFQNFGLAFLTLFRVATGDNWNGIMKDTLRDKCDPRSDCVRNCCVSQVIAPLYFVVFVLLAQFVLVNVVVAVLMKHLEESHHEMEVDEEYELDKQLAEELEAKKRALIEAKERQNLYWV